MSGAQALGRGVLAQWHSNLDLLQPAASVPEPAPLDFEPVLTKISSDSFEMTFAGLASFRIDFARHEVALVSAPAKGDRATIEHLLNDHVAPRLIAQLGHLVVHGSAVDMAGRLAIFMGTSGAGKSTLAASFLKDGHRLVGDDAIVVGKDTEGFAGRAVYPSLRLFPDSVGKVFAEAGVGTAAMAFYSDKQLVQGDFLGTDDDKALPIGMIFVLTDAERGVTLAAMNPAQACMVILKNSFAFDPDDAPAAARRMAQAAALANAVPCYALGYPYDFAILPAVRREVAALMDSAGAGHAV